MKAAFSLVLLAPSLCFAWTAGVWPASITSPRAIAWTNGIGSEDTNYVHAKDAWSHDCYTAVVERAYALIQYQYQSGNYPDSSWMKFYRDERSNCVVLKGWVYTNCTRFVNQSAAEADGSFTSGSIVYWTPATLLAYCGLPSDFWTNTPNRGLGRDASNGWDGLKSAISALRWTTRGAVFWQGEVGTGITCDLQCFPEGTNAWTPTWGEVEFPGAIACDVSIGTPESGLGYDSQLRAYYQAALEARVAVVDNGPYYDQFYVTLAASVTHEMNRGFPVVAANILYSNVTVAVDFYSYDFAYEPPGGQAAGWNPPDDDTSHRIAVLPASTGNTEDVDGQLASGYEWAGNAFFIAETAWPEPYVPVLDQSEFEGCDLDVEGALTLIPAPCYEELRQIVLGAGGPDITTDPGNFYVGSCVPHVSGQAIIEDPFAVLKWNFRYN